MIYEPLTTERIRKMFKNNFDLCNFSIAIARNMILSGHPASLDSILENVEQRAQEENRSKIL
jgi:hypothetical protein